MADIEKIRKTLQSDMKVLSILELIVCALQVVVVNIMGIVVAVIFCTLLSAGYTRAEKQEVSAWVFGVVTGSLMMLTILNGDLIDFLLGLVLVVHSLKYKKTFEV